MYYINSQIIRALVRFLNSQGVAIAQLNGKLGKRCEYLNDSRYLYPLSDYDNLICFAAKQVQCDHLGLKFGQSLKAQSWGLLGHLALVSNNLEKVLQYAQQLHTLVRNAGTIMLHKEPVLSKLSWHANTQVSHFMVDELFSSWLSFAKHCCDHNAGLALEHVELTRNVPAPNSLKAYQAIFHCPITFNANRNQLTFKTDLLSSPLHNPNEELEQLLLAQVENISVPNDLLNQLNALIASQLPSVLTLDQVCFQLGFKKRTLQRNLYELKTSYSQLIDQLRKQRASIMLKQGYSALDIANKLGFSEQSALQRAFKRWHNCTPKEFIAKSQK